MARAATAKRTTPTTQRTNAFRQMLLERRKVLQDEVDARIKAGREGRLKEGGDDMEDSVADVQGDISLSLVRMQSETLVRVDQALVRLDAGQYGLCAQCGREIAERRLNAQPFAVRCQQCEADREQAQGDRDRKSQQPGSFWLFSKDAGS